MTAVVPRPGPPGPAGPATGPAGGVLAGTYPNPAFAVDQASQAELDAAFAVLNANLAAHAIDTTAVHGIADTANLVLTGDARLSDARAPTGAAGGVLGGTYPNPSFAADLATQAELDAAFTALTDALAAHATDTTGIHGIADTGALVADGDAAGGVLAGTFPAPMLAPTNLLADFNVPDVLPAPDWTSINVPGPRPLFKIVSGKLVAPGGGGSYAWHTPSGANVGPNCEVWVTLGAGTYWEIGLRMDAAGAGGYSLGYDSGTGRLTIMSDGGNTPLMDTPETVALAAGDSIRLRAFEGQLTAWYMRPGDTKWTFFRNAFNGDVAGAGRLSLYSTGGSYDAFGGGSLPLAPIDQPYHDSSRQVQVDFYDQFPTVDDGYARGYFENSLWVVNYPYRVLLVNVDGTVGAAQWRPVISATIQDHAPGSTDDQSKGYGGGFLWLNYGDPDYSVYVCNDATLGAAQWAKFASVAVQQHAIRDTIADAKGDLIAATGADTVARLPAGANGTALVADSGASSGLAYVAGRELQPTRYAAGRWYGLFLPGYPESVQWNDGWASYAPFYSYGLTIDRLSCRVNVAGEAGSVLRMGIYLNAVSGHDRPGALLFDAGTVAGDSIGTKQITGLSLAIPPGLAWTCNVPQNCPVTAPKIHSVASSTPLLSDANPGNTAAYGAMASEDGDVPGALPGTAIVTRLDLEAPAMTARAV